MIFDCINISKLRNYSDNSEHHLGNIHFVPIMNDASISFLYLSFFALLRIYIRMYMYIYGPSSYGLYIY